MQGTGLIWRPGVPEPEVVDLSDVGEMDMLAHLQDAVGGHIEAVPGFETIEVRDRECLHCHHKWTSPILLSEPTANLSGEASVWCPECNTRNVMSLPVKTPACVAFCNEEGKLIEGMLFNNRATVLWDRALRRGGNPRGLMRPDGNPADVLLGAVIVVFGDAEFMASL